MENELSTTYHIAICDDDEAYIQYAKELFLHAKEKDEHFVFYEFQSGEELLRGLTGKEKCDLLFLDIQLNGMDGNATAKAFRIHLAHIQYIEIAKRGCIIHTFQNGEKLTYLSSTKVAEYYDKLSDFGFAYAHNSYIVHLNSISMITAAEIELISGDKLTISRSHSKEFKRTFAAYLSQKY